MINPIPAQDKRGPSSTQALLSIMSALGSSSAHFTAASNPAAEAIGSRWRYLQRQLLHVSRTGLSVAIDITSSQYYRGRWAILTGRATTSSY